MKTFDFLWINNKSYGMFSINIEIAYFIYLKEENHLMYSFVVFAGAVEKSIERIYHQPASSLHFTMKPGPRCYEQ